VRPRDQCRGTRIDRPPRWTIEHETAIDGHGSSRSEPARWTASHRPDLPYVQLPAGEMIGALVGAGFSADAAARHVAMCDAINAGRVVPVAGRTPANTTPTRFEDLVGDLVGAAV
jgi:hypothetical protein